MTLEWIMEEEEKWKRECEYLNNPENQTEPPIYSSLKKWISDLNEEMGRYYLEKFEDDEAYVEDLIKLKIVSRDEMNGDLKVLPLKFQYTTETSNAGYKAGTVFLNPNSASLLYNAYRRILEGDMPDIRPDIDYENISPDNLQELEKLNQNELIYWCYVHQVSFEEFSKMTMTHECSHHYVLSLAAFGDPLLLDMIDEGMTEKASRVFSSEKQYRYLPLYRNKEVEFIDRTLEDSEVSDFNDWIFYCADVRAKADDVTSFYSNYVLAYLHQLTEGVDVVKMSDQIYSLNDLFGQSRSSAQKAINNHEKGFSFFDVFEKENSLNVDELIKALSNFDVLVEHTSNEIGEAVANVPERDVVAAEAEIVGGKEKQETPSVGE